MDSRPSLPCRVNGYLFHFTPDTGSDITILTTQQFNTFSKHFGAIPKLRPVTKTIRAANDTAIVFRGSFSATLSSPSSKIREEIYVKDSSIDSPPLLSEKALRALGFIQYCAHGSFVVKTVTETDDPDDLTEEELAGEIKRIHAKFPSVFRGVGCFKNFKLQC